MQQEQVTGLSSGEQVSARLACALVCDHKLAIPAGALAARIAKSWNIDVHVFIERPNGIEDKVIETNARRVTYHYEELFTGGLRDLLPDHPRFSRAAWGRVFIPKILANYDRILYCDVDVLPGKLPSGIEFIDLPGGVGMVRDSWPFRPFVWSLPRDQQYPTNLKGFSKYFNSGVLLIDPSRWDHDKILRSVRDFILGRGAQSLCPDQDFLNLYFSDVVTELSPSMNFQEPLMGLGLAGHADICIRHFCGSMKPFHILPDFGAKEAVRSASVEFQEMVEESGLLLPALFPNEGIKRMRQIKSLVRLGLHKIGIAGQKVRRLEKDWHVRRRIALSYIQTGFDMGEFADVNVFEFENQEFNLKFNGIEVYV